MPDAERRLRASFPEVWAWYELIVAVRGVSPVDPASEAGDEEPSARTSVRR